MTHKITTEINVDGIVNEKTGAKIHIEQKDYYNGKLTRHSQEVMDLRDKATMEALIELGWTPPQDA